jgi:hypothetical protein
MNKKLTKKLLDKYPKLFRQASLSPQDTSMCFGFQCGDGWYNLINWTCSQLQWDIDRNGYPQIEFNTIKEKFGTLRLYYHVVGDIKDFAASDRGWTYVRRAWFNPLRFILGETYRRRLSSFELSSRWANMIGSQSGTISFAELISEQFCEACGSTDDVQMSRGGWVTVRCSKCRQSLEQLK